MSTTPAGVKQLEIVLPSSNGLINDLAWSPDGRLLAAARDGGDIALYDFPGRTSLNSLQGPGAEVLGVAWSPDGTRLAAGVGDGIVWVWTWTGPPTAQRFPHAVVKGKKKPVVYGVAWSPLAEKGLLASFGTDKLLYLWDAFTGKKVGVCRGHTEEIYDASWSSDGERLVSVSYDGSVRIWNATRRNDRGAIEKGQRLKLPDDGWGLSVEWIPRPTAAPAVIAVGCEDGALALWDGQASRPFKFCNEQKDALVSVVLSSDGRFVASKSYDDTIYLRRTDNWEPVAWWDEPNDEHFAGLAFSPDSRKLATLGRNDKAVRIWELDVETLWTINPPVVYPPVQRVPSVTVTAQAQPPAAEAPGAHVLMLTANIDSKAKLDLGAEYQLIQQALDGQPADRRLRLRMVEAPRAGELPDLLRLHRPRVLHFSGHGTEEGDLLFSDGHGGGETAPLRVLAERIASLDERPQCIVLNNCFSLTLADALAPVVPYVVGMSDKILDESAREFAAGFYSVLAGKPGAYSSAFINGRKRVQLDRLPDHEVPHFIGREGEPPADESREYFSTRVYRAGKAKTPTYRVWYGTNRKPISDTDVALGYGSERDGKIHYGACDVTIPPSRPFGTLGSDFLRRLITWTDDRMGLVKSSLVLRHS